MNDSGRSVGPAAAFFKLEPSEVLVVHDEGDFDLGRLELKVGGGLAGHNGLRSIAQQLGTPDFLRLRIGVGRPERGDPRPLADWVLADFEPHDDAGRARRARGGRGRAARRRRRRADAASGQPAAGLANAELLPGGLAPGVIGVAGVQSLNAEQGVPVCHEVDVRGPVARESRPVR